MTVIVKKHSKNYTSGCECMSEKVAMPIDNDSEKLNLISNIIYPSLYNENQELTQRNRELESELKNKTENNNELIQTCANQAREINALKEKLKHAQDVINTNENSKQTNDSRVFFNKYEYDLMDFVEDVTTDDVNGLFNKLIELTNIKVDNDNYLIDCASAVIPVYIMLTKSQKIVNTKNHFEGNLKSFCGYWNKNVVSNIEDKERANCLICNYDSIKVEMNKAPWKNVGPAKWRMMALDSKTRNKKPLNRAYNIKGRMESLFNY